MHGHVSYEDFILQVSGFLTSYYLFVAIMNAFAALYLWQSGRAQKLFRLPVVGLQVTSAHAWSLVAIVFTVLGAYATNGGAAALTLPESLREAADSVMNPVVYTVGSLVLMSVLYLGRNFFVKPTVAWAGLNLSLLVMGLSMTDMDFASIVMKPDNVPIVGMIYLLGFFTWLSANRAVENDARIARGEVVLEKLDDEKVLVWPDLVYIELICMIGLCALLFVWAILLQAPLEEPASSVKTPNPSKAPWYFLGLQEMLVYYDPWMAGVVLPGVIVGGLMAVPFIDFNKLGNGYYTINERKFAYCTFQFGFLVLWVTLIVMGTFLRGPNWNFFGFYETWDAHKVEALNNIDLSQRFWIDLLHMGRPKAADDASMLIKIVYIIVRESPGILLLTFYFGGGPPAMVIYSKFFREMFMRMGFVRYMVLSNLILLMALLPIKMLARWTVNMKYFISIPEYFLNF
jgi:Cytochrome b(C-terminal)/b6/petD